MLGVRQMSRAAPRGQLQLTLCEKLALTLALADVDHPPHVLISHVVNYVPTRRSRMCGPPPRHIFCDARNVAVEAASLKLYVVLLVSDHCSRKGITLSGIEALTKRRLVSGATGAGSSSSSDQAEVDATRTIREESVTPSRRAPHEVQRFSSGRQPWTHIVAAVQGARAHPARHRQSSGRISSVVRRVGISGTPLGTEWRQLTTNYPPFRKPSAGAGGSGPSRADHVSDSFRSPRYSR